MKCLIPITSRRLSKNSNPGEMKKALNCPGCLTKQEDVFPLSCGHTYCRDCIRGLFTVALKDKSYVPVKCCGKRVDQRLRREVLSLEELIKFEADLEDIEAQRKMYCPRKGCGKFYNLDKVANSFSCVACKAELCSKCRTSHPSITCAQYNALPLQERSMEDVQFLQLAQRCSYARCSCGRFVELASGCNTIYCKCGRTFGYREQRYTGLKSNPVTLSTVYSPPSLPPADASVKSAYELEEQPCQHAWVDCNTVLEKRDCHLCRRNKFSYQSACTKCHVRACAGCRFNKSVDCVVM